MKNKCIIICFISGMTLLSNHVGAEFKYSQANNDLLMAFHKPGTSYDLIVNLGPLGSQNYSVAYVTPQNITATFGSWDNSIKWSVFGVGSANTLIASKSGDTSWTSKSSFAQGTPASSMISVGNSAMTDGIDYSDTATKVSSSFSGGYTAKVGLTGNWNYFNEAPGTTEMTGPGTLNIFQMPTGSGPGSLLGTVTMTSGGNILVAIPEPATLQIFSAGLLVLGMSRFWGRR